MELISAKYLITMDGPVIKDGAIAIENGEIIEVGPHQQLLSDLKIDKHEHFAEHVLMPGLVNAHAHLELSHLKNYANDPVRKEVERPSFVNWLLTTINTKKRMSPVALTNAIKEGIEESLQSGTTCIGCMDSFEGIFDILIESGIRSTIFAEIANYDRKIAKDLYQSALALLEKYENASDLVKPGLGPYAPYILSKNFLKLFATYGSSTKTPVMIHAAESFSEMEFFYNSSGEMATTLFPAIGWGNELPPPFHKTPITYLDEIGFLKSKPILAGVVQATKEDLDRIKTSGAKVVITPRMNHYLKLGESPLSKLLEREIPVGIGTDGIASNANLSLWDEMRFVFQTVDAQKNLNLTGEKLLKMATISGAQALGLENTVGSLTQGKQADFIVVKSAWEDGESFIPDLYTDLIMNTKSYHISKVVVAGNSLKQTA